MSEYFNPFQTFEACKQTYQSFIDSYHKFTKLEIENWIKRNSLILKDKAAKCSNNKMVEHSGFEPLTS